MNEQSKMCNLILPSSHIWAIYYMTFGLLCMCNVTVQFSFFHFFFGSRVYFSTSSSLLSNTYFNKLTCFILHQIISFLFGSFRAHVWGVRKIMYPLLCCRFEIPEQMFVMKVPGLLSSELMREIYHHGKTVGLDQARYFTQ